MSLFGHLENNKNFDESTQTNDLKIYISSSQLDNDNLLVLLVLTELMQSKKY